MKRTRARIILTKHERAEDNFGGWEVFNDEGIQKEKSSEIGLSHILLVWTSVNQAKMIHTGLSYNSKIDYSRWFKMVSQKWRTNYTGRSMQSMLICENHDKLDNFSNSHHDKLCHLNVQGTASWSLPQC